MTQDHEIIRMNLDELLAAEEFLDDLVSDHLKAEPLRQRDQAQEECATLQSVVQQHVSQLKTHLDSMDDSAAGVRTVGDEPALAAKLNAMADSRQSRTATQMLRDQYGSLSLVAISYTMLHTQAAALGDDATAKIALDHLQDLTPRVVKLSRVIPYVVAEDIRPGGSG